MNNLVENFSWHGTAGYSILASDWLGWVNSRNGKENHGPDNGYGFGKITHYTWLVNSQLITAPVDPEKNIHVLPDATGFVCFERGDVPNNCALLDIYGKERMRLTVPWQLTTANNPESNAPPTCFVGLSDPYINPADGKKGAFGVKAWVEFGGEYYFELDWHTGEFLWGREIRF
jgi:hypothetical protein